MVQAEQVQTISQHATKRCQQRGINHAMLIALQEFGDRSIPVGRNCVALSLSRREARRLRKEGICPPAMLERLDRLILIVAPTGVLASAFDANARRYRKTWN
jgi:hypothetical protein